MEAEVLFQKLLLLPLRIGAIFLFDGMTHKGVSRLNYNADPGFELSHQEIVQLEELMNMLPGWEM